MDTPLLSVEGLAIAIAGRHGAVPVVSDLSFALPRGGAIGLVGESGAGKSLTAAAICGLLTWPVRQTGGRILLDGRRIDGLSPAAFQPLRGRRTAAVFQDPLASLDPLFTIGSQLVETVRLHRRLGPRAARRAALDLLGECGVPGPERLLPLYPHELSGGLRQRVVIALAMAGEPELLVADEPTSALDVALQAQLLGLFNRLRRAHGLALLLISHDLAVVGQVADRVLVMRQGRVVEDAPVRDVATRPRHPYTARLVAAMPRLDSAAMAGPAAAPAAVPPAVEVTGLGKDYRAPAGRFVALDGVSLAIPRGASFGLVGESGSGKSTLARCILGLEAPSRGRVTLHGPEGRRPRAQMVFQDPLASLDPRWRVGAIVAEPLRARGVPAAERRRRAGRLLEQVGLAAADGDRLPHEFSGGQRQRIAIARALAAEPDLLVCDEPTASLDVSVQAQILALIKEVQRRSGMTLLFISHHLAVVRQMVDTLGVLQQGRLVECGAVDAVLRQPVHPYTRQLVAAVPRLPGAAG